MKILAGVITDYEGLIELNGQESRFKATIDAEESGIRIIHQELNLAENLDVAGSIYLGREPSRLGLLDLAAMRRDARKWLARVGLDIDPGTLCGTLPIAQRQLVEIAKALSCEARILILDEPTSSLSAREADRLLEIMAELRGRGVAVVFVSHHLDEVMRIADRVVVLRDGHKTGELARGAYDRATVERLMVGRDLARVERRASRADSRVRLKVEGLLSAHRKKSPVSFEVRAGEIVGLAGLVGAGRTEVLEAIAGITHAGGRDGGRVMLDGTELVGASFERVRRGVAIVPEDRARNGLFLEDPVSMNMSLAWLDRSSRARLVDGRGERSLVGSMIARMQLRPAQPARRVQTLSGGNQQKVVLSQWINIKPEILILDEPTRGIDVGAKYEIYLIIQKLVSEGKGVIVISSELPELIGICDRIYAISEGVITGEVERKDFSPELLMKYMTKEKEKTNV
jgi:ribose transport system ATP-binding protein